MEPHRRTSLRSSPYPYNEWNHLGQGDSSCQARLLAPAIELSCPVSRMYVLGHIRLIEAVPGKLAALDQLLEVYLPLCQQYVALFCTQETLPDKYTDPVCNSLSERLHRVAMQQAAGIARSWRTNRQAAYLPTWKTWLITRRPRSHGIGNAP